MERLSPRDRILDAAAQVMRDDGISRATTKQIAAAAGYSEAMLYKSFSDKQDIFLAVLTERVPKLAQPDSLVGRSTVSANLEVLLGQLLSFYVQTFPIAASIFSSKELLSSHREAMRDRKAGPHVPSSIVQRYLDAEQAAGRLQPDCDTRAVAVLLTGAALHESFLAAFDGRTSVPHRAAVARQLISVIKPYLADGPAGPSSPATTSSDGPR